MGRIRLHVALDCSAYSLETFILDNVEAGSTIATDSWKSYNFIEVPMKNRTKAVARTMKTCTEFIWLLL
jgi:hypothetical protein